MIESDFFTCNERRFQSFMLGAEMMSEMDVNRGPVN